MTVAVNNVCVASRALDGCVVCKSGHSGYGQSVFLLVRPFKGLCAGFVLQTMYHTRGFAILKFVIPEAFSISFIYWALKQLGESPRNLNFHFSFLDLYFRGGTCS